MNKELERVLSSPKLESKLERKESFPRISLGSPKLERALSSPKLEGKLEKLEGKLKRAAPKLKLDLKPKDDDSDDLKPRKLKNKFKPTIDLSAFNTERRRSSENLEKGKVYQLFEKLKSLAPEDNLDDKYIKIDKKLASGMYGVVGFYYKKNSPIDKMYIVKAISYKKGFDVSYDNDSIKIEVYNKLINEIVSLKRMQENNCKETNFVDLCFIEVFRDDENIYIVTRFKNDTISLQKYIEQNTLTFKQIYDILLVLLNKLKIIHSLNIVHNDIKPANILVQYNKNGIVDLSYIDYGETCLCDESDICLTSGSVYYHPENVLYITRQLCNLTYYNDIYSLGITVNELLDKSKIQNDAFVKIINENMLNQDMYDKPYTIDFLNNLIKTLTN
jgi:hypothetical protein